MGLYRVEGDTLCLTILGALDEYSWVPYYKVEEYRITQNAIGQYDIKCTIWPDSEGERIDRLTDLQTIDNGDGTCFWPMEWTESQLTEDLLHAAEVMKTEIAQWY